MMNKSGFLLLFLLCLTGVPAEAQQNQFGGSLAVGADEVFIGETQNVVSAGTVYVYRRDASGAWAEHAQLSASDADPKWDDRFGRALAADPTTLLVGATKKGGTRGGVYVFEKNNAGMWTEVAQLTAADGADDDHLGRTLALDRDVALVAALGHDESRGAVYVYRRETSGAWTEQTKLTPDSLASGDYFGMAVALDGDKALISSPFQNDGQGAVYAYRYDANTERWVEEGMLEAEGVGERHQFGSTLSLQGEIALVGSPRYEGNLGAAYVFHRDAASGTWMFQDRLTPSDGEQGRFGSALAFDGNELWVGSPGASQFQGAIYRYQREGDGWTEVEKLTGRDVEQGNFFAGTLALGAGLAVVGVTGADYGSGRATLFEREADAWEEKNTVFNEGGGIASIMGDQVDCNDGVADRFDCNQVDLVSFLSVRDLGGARGVGTNDVWGWTDAQTGKEYAIVGRMDGTSFVDISDPYQPRYLGDLPKTEGSPGSTWRDMKVYKDHAFIVSDGASDHGMQVFDLTQLRTLENAPVLFEETAHYDGIHSAHNIVINEETGFAYSVGSSAGGETCGGGLHMIDVREPTNPTFAGCFADAETGRASTGYSHDAQCVTYNGPDIEHRDKEVCFGANETALSIADVTDKENPIALSRASYPSVGYSHQGWLTDDHRHFLMNDELDELQGKVDGTRTLIWDVTDLDDPQLLKAFISDNKASDHNLYIKGNLMYQSNYQSGLRIFDISDIENPVEVAYFDTVPYGENAPGFGGSWSNYPYFKSGVIVVTSKNEGMFLLKKREIDI